jgi:DHA1 family tetracycline resistance protein-like MFS transporter
MSNRTPALSFIFITMLIDMIGLGIIIPVMPGLIVELSGIPPETPHLMAYAAMIGMWLTISYSGMQFFCAPVLGGLSDRFGRRPVLLAALFGLGVDYVFLAFAPTLGWLFAGRIFAGMMGASFSAAGAYIADISTPEKRAQNFGLIGAAFGLGFILGPLLGGWLGTYGLRVPFMVCAGLSLLNCLFGLFVLPESLKPENRRTFDWKRANPVGAFKSFSRYPVILGLIFALFLIYISAHAVQSNWSFFVIEKFHWSTLQIGISLGVVGVAFAVIQGGLIRIIIPKLGQHRSVYFGLALYALGFLCYGIAPYGWMMYPAIIIYCFGSIAGPAIQGITSTVVPPNEQGELQGGFTSMASLAAIIGPLLMGGIFYWFSGAKAPVYFPGAAMVFGAMLTVISALLARNTLMKHIVKTI